MPGENIVEFNVEFDREANWKSEMDLDRSPQISQNVPEDFDRKVMDTNVKMSTDELKKDSTIKIETIQNPKNENENRKTLGSQGVSMDKQGFYVEELKKEKNWTIIDVRLFDYLDENLKNSLKLA